MMKHALFIFTLVVGLISWHPSDPKLPPLQITHVSGDCYVFVTYHMLDGKPYPANAMYVLTPAGAVLFDTPWDTTQCRPLLDSIWTKHKQHVVLCISTHFHADRTGGIPSLRAMGVKTYASAMTDSLCRLQHEPRPEFVFTHDTVFTVGGTRIITYYPGPGHTLDNIVLWLEQEKLLYGGCLVKSTEADDIGYMDDGDVQKYPIAIRNLQQRYPVRHFVIPGHLGWRDTSSLDHTLALIRTYGQDQTK